jgi:hypothetical protein
LLCYEEGEGVEGGGEEKEEKEEEGRRGRRGEERRGEERRESSHYFPGSCKPQNCVHAKKFKYFVNAQISKMKCNANKIKIANFLSYTFLNTVCS